jgi:hypothetical protein
LTFCFQTFPSCKEIVSSCLSRLGVSAKSESVGSVNSYLVGGTSLNEHVVFHRVQLLQGYCPSHFCLRSRQSSQACDARVLFLDGLLLGSGCRSVLLYESASKPRFILAKQDCSGACKNDLVRSGSEGRCRIDYLVM